MKLSTLFIVISVVFLNSNLVEAKAWRGIEPLRSNRADVERIFGSKVVRCGGSACIYDLGEEIVFVLYAKDSSCKNDGATTAWKVAAGTVIEIGVRFKEDKPLSELEFDLSKFERIEDKHLPGWIYYVNLDEGVRVEGGLITASSVTYFQSAKTMICDVPQSTIKNQDKLDPSANPQDPISGLLPRSVERKGVASDEGNAQTQESKKLRMRLSIRGDSSTRLFSQ